MEYNSKTTVRLLKASNMPSLATTVGHKRFYLWTKNDLESENRLTSSILHLSSSSEARIHILCLKLQKIKFSSDLC